MKRYQFITEEIKILRSFHHKVDYLFYKNSVDYILERVKKPFFLLFSDNPLSIDTLFQNYPHRLIKNDLDYVDLWAISMCKHHIMSASHTFCWWGVYLSINRKRREK